VKDLYAHINFVPPAAVANAAKEGLALRAKFRRGGTVVGLSRGEQLSKRHTVSPTDILRIYSYFARHEVDKRGEYFYDSVKPSNGYIAWMLWGGDAGQEWATKIRNQMLEAKRK
jgi:hypothetical protein